MLSILSTGGTIANTNDVRVSIDQVLTDIQSSHPDRKIRDDLRVVEVSREGGESLTEGDWLRLARAVQTESARSEVDGVVVTHGTFTLEETAYWLHLVIDSQKPLILTCSQRRHGTLGNDGDRNLTDALLLASEPGACGLGVLVVENEVIHSAREVRKTSRRPGGFTSGLVGALGTIDDDGVALYRTPLRRHTYNSEFRTPRMLPPVGVVNAHIGADGRAIRAMVGASTRGVVVNGFSFSGSPHEDQLSALRSVAERGIPIVLANRGGDGRARTSGEFVGADNLPAQKARILLALAVGAGIEGAEMNRVFRDY